MVCIHCQSKTQVINSRHQKRSNQVWRRRRCINGHVFTTQEATEISSVWLVSDRTGALRPFERDRLFMSLHNSLQHRTTAIRDAGALADTIMQQLVPEITNGVISSLSIRDAAQVALDRFDSAASTHYRAFHPDPR